MNFTFTYRPYTFFLFMIGYLDELSCSRLVRTPTCSQVNGITIVWIPLVLRAILGYSLAVGRWYFCSSLHRIFWSKCRITRDTRSVQNVSDLFIYWGYLFTVIKVSLHRLLWKYPTYLLYLFLIGLYQILFQHLFISCWVMLEECTGALSWWSFQDLLAHELGCITSLR